MLGHPVFTISQLIDTNYYYVEEISKIYVSFPLGNHQFKIKEVTRDIADNLVIIFDIFQRLWLLKQGSRIYKTIMLDFPPLFVVTSTYYHSSMTDKYPTLYVRSCCLLMELKLTDTNY